MLSLVDANTSVTRPALIEPQHHLLLSMNDIAAYRPDLIAPETAHIHALLDFTKKWVAAPTTMPLLIHCWLGISRSPAAAFIIACALNPQRHEQDLADDLRTLAPTATPNSRLVALADHALAREGRMIAAIRSIGRGADASAGTAFQWEI